MIISRCDISRAVVADVLAEWADLPSELETVTGWTWEEYQGLGERLQNSSYEIVRQDEHMLHQAANKFYGYPGMTTEAVEALLGSDWRLTLKSAFMENDQ